MFERYISMRLLQDLPRPVLNSIWYLWEVYCDPDAQEFRVSLCAGDNENQQFVIYSTGNTITKDFDCQIDVEIAILTDDTRCFMGYR